MKYDFSVMLNAKDIILEDFIDNYTSYVDISEDGIDHEMTKYYEKIFSIFHASFESETMLSLFREFTEYKVSQEIPYIIVSNEVHNLMHLLISSINTADCNENVISLLALFKEIDNTIAHQYLMRYIESLISLNSIRRNSLSDLVEKNIIVHYESHLIWLTQLAQQIKQNSIADFPELNPCLCTFGRWLSDEAKLLIQNNSKYLAISNMHNSLHLLAQKIHKILLKKEYHILINYLEKCELMSLSLGTELALLDNIMINKKIRKDTLTGAHNRNGLRAIFQSHYELALATSNAFILAICDLDYFKKVNDTYGHIAGDRVLKAFVDIVKKNIRNSDVVIRYGGEEFVIMLPAMNEEKGFVVLNKIREEFEKSFLEFNGLKIQTTVSIGMMEVKPHITFEQGFLDDYIMHVDSKLYYAKKHGRNKVIF